MHNDTFMIYSLFGVKDNIRNKNDYPCFFNSLNFILLILNYLDNIKYLCKQ